MDSTLFITRDILVQILSMIMKGDIPDLLPRAKKIIKIMWWVVTPLVPHPNLELDTCALDVTNRWMALLRFGNGSLKVSTCICRIQCESQVHDVEGENCCRLSKCITQLSADSLIIRRHRKLIAKRCTSVHGCFCF